MVEGQTKITRKIRLEIAFHFDEISLVCYQTKFTMGPGDTLFFINIIYQTEMDTGNLQVKATFLSIFS